MSSYRLGARDLPLSIDWQVAFLPMGTTAAPARDVVFLDVGGALAPGVIDQHQGGSGAGSTSEIVFANPELVYQHLMSRWLDRHERGEALGRWRFCTVTHQMPDFDAVVAIWLTRHLIETGRFPPIAAALVAYTSMVDQGSYKVDLARPETATAAVHMAFLATQNLEQARGSAGNAWCVEEGLTLIDRFVSAVASARSRMSPGVPEDVLLARLVAWDLVPGQPGVGSWRDDARFTAARVLLDGDLERYRLDCQGAEKTRISLPAREGTGVVEAPALVLPKPPTSVLNKYWVRAEKFALFVCPYGSWGGRNSDTVGAEARYPRVVISVDPTWQDEFKRHASLRGLGAALEAAETQHREKHGGDIRLKVPRWPDGSVDNWDPWYDGRGHDHTIVDAPNSGTFLPYGEVKRIATGPFWHLPLAEAEVWVLQKASARGGEGPASPRARSATTAETLAAWFEDSRSMVLEQGEFKCNSPAGFVVARATEHRFPFHEDGPLVPPKDLVELKTPRDSGGATLDGLVDWARTLEPTDYMFARVRIDPRRASDPRADALLRELCVGGVTIGSPSQDGELTLFNGRAVAARASLDPSPGLWSERGLAIIEVLLFAAFQAEALAQFSMRAAAAVTTGGTIRKGEEIARLSRQFLVFQARYFHIEVTRDEFVREVYRGLREALGLDRLHEKVESELDRLDQMQRERTQRWVEALLFLVGLTGVVQVFEGWEGLTRTTLAGAICTCAGAIALFGFLWLRQAGEAGWPGMPQRIIATARLRCQRLRSLIPTRRA